MIMNKDDTSIPMEELRKVLKIIKDISCKIHSFNDLCMILRGGNPEQLAKSLTKILETLYEEYIKVP